MTSYDVRNDKSTIFTWNNPRYQILSSKNITKGGIVVVCRSIIGNYIDILIKMTKIDVNYDVRNKKLTILTWNNPRCQILLLKNITEGGIVFVCRSITSNFIDVLRKMKKNDVNNDVKWRQKRKIDYFEIK